MDDTFSVQRPLSPVQNMLRERVLVYLREELEAQRREGIPLEPLDHDYGESMWFDFQHMEPMFGSRENFLVYYYLPAMMVLNRYYKLR